MTTLFRYYDLQKNWRKVRPHLQDAELNAVLVQDLKVYRNGRFEYGLCPADRDCSSQRIFPREGRPGRRPAYWQYAMFHACHWLVNFNLHLATLIMPDEPWRIITSDKHSTVWSGGCLLLDFNYQALEPDQRRVRSSSRHC